MRHFKEIAISHLRKPVYLILPLIILFSCGPSERQKAEVDGIDTIQVKNALGVPVSPAIAIPLPLQDNRITSTYVLRSNGRVDTLVIYEDSYDPNSKYGLKWVKKPNALYNLKGINGSNSHVIVRSKFDSSYVFLIASKPMKIEKDSIWALTILVCKDHEVVSESSFPTIDFRSMKMIGGLENHTYSLDGVDECFVIHYRLPETGNGTSSSLFMLKGDKIVEGLGLFSDGESVADERKFVPAQATNQIWVERSLVLYGEETPIVCFTEILKYAVAEDGTKLLNPKKDNFQYINVQTGLSLQAQPVIQNLEELQSLEEDEEGDIQEESSTKLPGEFSIKFGGRVNVLNETSILHKAKRNGKIVSGRWVYVEYNYVYQNSEHPIYGFVFDRDLSTVKPQK